MFGDYLRGHALLGEQSRYFHADLELRRKGTAREIWPQRGGSDAKVPCWLEESFIGQGALVTDLSIRIWQLGEEQLRLMANVR